MNHDELKKLVPTCEILGVRIAAIDMGWLLNFTHAHIKELSGDYMCVSNVHTTVTAFNDYSYRDVQNGGIMAIPDGGPLSSVGRKRGYENMRRVTGPSYMQHIFSDSGKKGYRHFFYGATAETTNKMLERISNNYDNVTIAGVYNPPFRPLTDQEDREVIDLINASNPDFIWVGLGAPKQEIWMANHKGKVKGFMIGVGAAFDYLAGNIKRAPDWMQKRNLEWFYRFLQDPKRLFKRYLVTNSIFIWHAVIRRK